MPSRLAGSAAASASLSGTLKDIVTANMPATYTMPAARSAAEPGSLQRRTASSASAAAARGGGAGLAPREKSKRPRRGGGGGRANEGGDKQRPHDLDVDRFHRGDPRRGRDPRQRCNEEGKKGKKAARHKAAADGGKPEQ